MVDWLETRRYGYRSRSLGSDDTLACGQARLPVRQQPPGPDFLIIGHRSAPNQACENTLESFEEALQLGANALELDVSMTSDQHVRCYGMTGCQASK